MEHPEINEVELSPVEQARGDLALEQYEPWLKYFDWRHLAGPLHVTSMHFGKLAETLVRDLGGYDDGQVTMMLQHLLIAKDAAVRAALTKYHGELKETLK